MPSAATRPVLPGALVSLLEALADSLDRKRYAPETVQGINVLLQGLPPTRSVEIDRQIRDVARLHHHRRTPHRALQSFVQRLGGHGGTHSGADLAILEEHCALAPVFLSHGNGRIREAALDRLESIDSSYLVCALAIRLNDWAAPVRYAAMDCAERLLPTTRAAVIARAAWDILPRRATWSRGGDALLTLDTALLRPDVVETLVAEAIARPTGGAMRLVAELSRTPVLDRYLPDLARKSRQPNLRALAYRFMLEGFAAWPDGFEMVWVDKTFGAKRRRRRYARRPLTTFHDAGSVVEEAARDRSAVVRAVAADVLIKRRRDLPAAISLARTLAKDSHPGVRNRADFILKDLEG